RSAGFTLVELLVVTAIVSVLMALLLAAVQRVREAANRAKCANNLRQVGLAILQYHDTSLQLPATFIRQDWATWAVLILPYIEQSNEYKLWDTQLRYYDQANRNNSSLDPTGRNIPTYFCPSRRSAGGLSTANGTTETTQDVPSMGHLAGYSSFTHRAGGLGDYAACN